MLLSWKMSILTILGERKWGGGGFPVKDEDWILGNDSEFKQGLT